MGDAAWGRLATGVAILVGILFLGVCVGGLIPEGEGQSNEVEAWSSPPTENQPPAATASPIPPEVTASPSSTLETHVCTAAETGPTVYRRMVAWAVRLSVSVADGQATGSGFVVRPGWVATNQHVVAGAQAVSVFFGDGSSSNGTVRWADADEDLALVAVDRVSNAAPAASWTTASPGDPVYVLGAPLGLSWSFTSGIVSQLRPTDIEGRPHIQFDAAVNPGNSGGPLVDACGRVIGLVRLKLRVPGEGDQMAENVNFARPVDALAPGLAALGM